MIKDEQREVNEIIFDLIMEKCWMVELIPHPPEVGGSYTKFHGFFHHYEAKYRNAIKYLVKTGRIDKEELVVLCD